MRVAPLNVHNPDRRGADVRELLPVRRPGRVVAEDRRDLPEVAAVGVHYPEVPVAGARAAERDLRSIRRPGRIRVDDERVSRRRDLRLPAPVRVHDPDVRASTDIALVGDPGAVGRPGRCLLSLRCPREPPLGGAVGADRVELGVPARARCEDDPAIRARRRRTGGGGTGEGEDGAKKRQQATNRHGRGPLSDRRAAPPNNPDTPIIVRLPRLVIPQRSDSPVSTGASTARGVRKFGHGLFAGRSCFAAGGHT